MFKKIFALLVIVGMVSACSPKTATVTQIKQTDPEAFRKMAPKAGSAPVIQLGDYQTFTMSNGLIVILVEDHNTPAVSFSLSIDQPPFNEGEKAGYAEMAGDLLANGTKTMSKADIDESIDFIGARLHAYSQGIYGNSLTKHKHKLLAVMSDVLLNPTFPEEELEKLRKQMLSGLQQAKVDPGAMASNVAGVLNYGKNHPYGEIVSEETVEKVTRQDCVDFYNKYFLPNISYLVVTGDIKMDELKTLANKYFGAWKKGDVPKIDMPKVKFPKNTSIIFVNKPGAVQSKIKITYPLDMKPGSPDRIKARVANGLLGGFFGSRLNKNLREDKAYTYGARSSIGSDRYVASFTAGADVRNEVTDSALVQFIKEMKRIATERPADDEVKRVKSVLAGQFARSMEDKATIARFALSTMKYDLPKDYYATYLTRLSEVTPKDVLSMSKKYIKPAKANIIIVGSQDDVIPKLKRMTPAGGLHFYDGQGNKVEAPKRSIAGLTAVKVINKYVDAIGGKSALEKVKSIQIISEGSVQGQTMKQISVLTTSDKGSMRLMVGGQTMQNAVYNGGKGYQEAMGQKKPMDKELLDEMKGNVVPFKELVFNSLGSKLVLKSVEVVDGKEVYRIVETSAAGEETSIYYDADTGYKIQEVSSGDGMTITTKYGDYKEVEGVKYPHSMSIVGAAPFPLEFKVTSIKVNPELGPDIFRVN